MISAPIILYLILFMITVLAPLRWSIIAFLILTNIDLGSLNASIGLLNTAKAMVLPVFLLWRLSAYSGHDKISPAPVLWGLLVVYVAIASSWSLFPAYAIKLLGHMIGSLVICLMLIRATKGGFLGYQTIMPVTCGVIGMAIFHRVFLHNWGGETERFTTFSGAQAFAAFATALYCAALFATSLKVTLRAILCVVLVGAVLANGSRLWIGALLLSTLLAVFVSETRTWIKVVTLGVVLILISICTVELDTLMEFMANEAAHNRIAAAISDVYGGNFNARGLGTYNLRHELFERTVESLETSTTKDLVFGHGTCNGALIAATLAKNPDPNRAMHNEWLRVLYEWGIVGLVLWILFILSLMVYAAQGVRSKAPDYAKPLLVYLPAFALGLSGENIIAGAGSAVSVGLLVLIALGTISLRASRPVIRWRPWPGETFGGGSLMKTAVASVPPLTD